VIRQQAATSLGAT